MPGPTSPVESVAVAIIGGSGLYDLKGLEDVRDVPLETPFGAPSAAFRIGTLGGRRVAVLARHGRGHTLLPTEVNYRANVYACKMLGVDRILSVSAVGSMKESLPPRDVVLVDQFIDRTHRRPGTFFGEGLVAHISFADPICPDLRGRLLQETRACGAGAHDGGTYVCIEGPAFSTRAESMLYRSWGVDVIGMTNVQEARLAREAEICYATMAMVTDYDCWHEDEQDVSVTGVMDNLQANAALAAKVVRRVVAGLSGDRADCDCGQALRHAILTPRDAIPEAARRRLDLLVGKYLNDAGS